MLHKLPGPVYQNENDTTISLHNLVTAIDNCRTDSDVHLDVAHTILNNQKIVKEEDVPFAICAFAIIHNIVCNQCNISKMDICVKYGKCLEMNPHYSYGRSIFSLE